MAIRDIRLFGDPVLRTVCDPITEVDDGVRALRTLKTKQLSNPPKKHDNIPL